MSLNDTPLAERIQIGFFGRTNTGKSSLVNSVLNQNVSIVSNTAGTTADAVTKAMELLPLGAVSLIDTAGLDDISQLGALRIEKTLKALEKTDIAVLVSDAVSGLTDKDREIIKLFEEKNIKYLIAYNKCDLLEALPPPKNNEIYVSALKNINIDKLKDKITAVSGAPRKHSLVSDLINENDAVILVTPIDEAAPKGRLILPQQMLIRDILDKGGIALAVKEPQLPRTLRLLPRPKLVITDSQVFKYVNSILPPDIPLTSFSILFARYKGILDTAVKGAAQLDNLKNGDAVLISEGCTHKRQCNDIGTVKLPFWIENYTKKKLHFDFSSGADFPESLEKYALIIHCGGCMLTEREVLNRYKKALDKNIPITNYGIAIAQINGILKRSTEILCRP